jgi:phospholipid N-methyltransferase
MDEKIMFLSAFLERPKQIGSVFPSSRYLIHEMLKNIDFKNAKCIIEYGPGTGCVTKEILKRARNDCKILCFELNRKMHRHISESIKDKRLILINDSAENILKHLSRLGIKKGDFIVSGIPFYNLQENKKNAIIEETEKALNENGKFVFFRYFTNFKSYLYSSFSKITTSFIPLNIPPCFVFVCEK